MNDVTENASIDAASAGAPSQPDTVALIELSDEEIVEWLSTSILDEYSLSDLHEPLASSLTFPTDPGFWDQVAALETDLLALGHPGDEALHRAIGILGVALSLRGDASPETRSQHMSPDALLEALGSIATDPSSLGERELLGLHDELLERAQRAVLAWSSLHGSALSAASNKKG